MRAACDRCHAQKLRCVCKPGAVRCERCSRLDSLCHFSPRAPRGSIRASSSTAEKTPNVQVDECALQSNRTEILGDTGNGHHTGLEPQMEYDRWLAPIIATSPAVADADADQNDIQIQQPQVRMDEFSFLSPEPLQVWEPMGQNLDIGPLQVPAPAPEPPLAMTSVTAQALAYLSIALSTLSEKLPSLPDGSDDCNGAPASSAEGSSNMPFVLDELFHLTSEFTDLIQHRLLGPDSGSQNEPTALMIASCHSRLTDIYTAIFSMIQRCVQHSLGPPRPRPNWAVILPKVQLGTLSSHSLRIAADTPITMSEGKAYMYMSMIAVYSGELLGKLGDAVRTQQRRGPGAVADTGAVGTFVNIIWARMVDQADSLLVDIEDTERLLRK
ncbi:Zn(II)2Cys6 transcription factor domain-containing protein [Aspergillus undulatus]|uniref:Zn(II)2Cys6 transcription factor domain-containing protein n=1 Tax=Aspergillus undulatus TaxID=1810928 RepID=UPI003CCE3E06